MECLPETGLSAGTTITLVAIALALIAAAIVLIIKSHRARAGALMALCLVGLLGALPLAGAPQASAGVDCNGANAVYVTETSTETAAGPTVTADGTVVTVPGSTVTATADGAVVTLPGTVVTLPGSTVTQTAPGSTETLPGSTVTETATETATTTATAAGPTVTVTETAPRECAAPPAWLTAHTTQGGWLQGESYEVSADDNATNAGGEDALAQIEEILQRGTVDGQALCDLKITWVQSIVQRGEPDNTMSRTLTYTGWNHPSNEPLRLGFDAGDWGQEPWFEWNNLNTTITAQLSFTRTGGGAGSSEITLSGPFQVALP
ncbi:MAG: hypothetical protein LBE25_12565 [Arthrobacter sp.]|jgi:hypothetical protein|nr:hypothetical protein [Arthrobacter sp.]